MKIIDRLDGDTVRKLNDLKKSNRKGHVNNKTSNERNSERLTRREIEELMGTRRQTYRRVNGKIKRK